MASKKAFEAVVKGETGKMFAFNRIEGDVYQIDTVLIDIKDVLLIEKNVPDNFINETKNVVIQEFIDRGKPLIGSEMPEMISFNDKNKRG